LVKQEYAALVRAALRTEPLYKEKYIENCYIIPEALREGVVPCYEKQTEPNNNEAACHMFDRNLLMIGSLDAHEQSDASWFYTL
jgi:hypothetical protein